MRIRSPRFWTDWRVLLAIGCVAVIVIAATSWLVVTATREQPRAREYLAATACLLTDARGISGRNSASVWSGMQKASLSIHAKVQFLATYGPDNAQNAIPYLNTLAQRQCSVIVAADPEPVSAIVSDAHRFPDTTFIVVGKKTTSQPNVIIVDTQPAKTADEVAQTVVDAVT